ncbi:cytochrome B [Idiomarina piscisalsi]|jgi:cytochrome b|uniref:Cytochrome B n=1 Tax=Idiomarina piscisalsi TaxID=1096243 RepID=A0ABM6LSI2_9GAMM|nr:cytochrome b/b6 domain-containing protein [Idiomarina piscisalsi]ASG65430.1 cytochrome B [Idiomarina piscisalsi]
MIQKENSVKVWDSFVRLFHLMIILLVIGLWWTADNGRMDLHKDFGVAILSLLVMRVAWGIFGSNNARFKAFVRSPLRIPSHLKTLFNGQYQPETTHSTAGGWAVLLMLALLIAQAVTGLFSSDGILFSGPLASWVSSDTQELLTDWHKTQFDAILVVIAFHILAVAMYRLKGIKLVGAMVHGYKNTTQPAPQLKPGWQGLLLAIAVWLLFMLLL